MDIDEVIARCQSLATDKEFICTSCKWAQNVTYMTAYCAKVGYSCNGQQHRPTGFCEDFERNLEK